MTKNKVKKIIKISVNVLVYVFFAICMFMLVLSLMAKKDVDGAISIFGKQWRVVVSDSMAECELTDVDDYDIKSIPVKSMIFIELVPEDEEEKQAWYSELKVGDVLTFKYVFNVNQQVITHRITDITEKDGGGYVIILKGDNVASENVGTMEQRIDTSLTDSTNYVIGKVTGQSYALGVFLTAVKSPIGIVFIIIVPCLVVAVFEIIKLVIYLTERKRMRTNGTKEEKDAEIEELKKRIEELQKSQADDE